MLPLLLEEALIQAKQTYQLPLVVWTDGTVTHDDIANFEREALEGKQFDPNGLKESVWNEYKSGQMNILCRECEFARVVAILPKTSKGVPEDWGRIFQGFGAPRGGKWNVYWFGAKKARLFPHGGAPLAAEHLNGGYTTICSNKGIFIYRIEEATRVLIHELLHAACLDAHDKSIPVREATIETWAEVLLVAYRSKGNPGRAKALWKLQCQWVADTNNRAANEHSVRSHDDYGWRYMNGRAHIYQELGLELPAPAKKGMPTSSRFTHPMLGD